MQLTSKLFSMILVPGLAMASVAQQSAAQETAPGSVFATVIRPLLEARCVECHGAEKQEGHLRLDTREAALSAGDTGYAAVIPGNATFSNLVKRITLPPEHADVMPPKEKGTLTAEEILALVHWINRGAEWDTVTLAAKAPAAAPAPAPAPAEPAPAPAPAPVEPAPAPAVPAAAPAGGVDFARDIVPILAARCFECHGPEKQKGELRLDSKETFLKGGENGPIVVAGKAGESTMCKLISLPAGDADIMPAKGDPLSKEQITMIAQWITEGANFGAWTVFAVETKEPANLLEKLAQDVQPAPAEKLAKLQEQGAVAMQLGQTSPLVRVDFQLAGEQVKDEALPQLAEIADQLTWLNLANTAITDAGLASLAPLKKLTSLHLEKTKITDAGLQQLCTLENLQYLNLYGTAVTDAGLEPLKGLKNLRRLYVWQTQVTAQGADGLKQAIPGLDVNLGAELQLAVAPAPAAEAPKVVLAVFFDKEGCCAKAAAEGKECDHPCCVEARAKGEVCAKCNPGAQPKQQLAAKFDKDACCAKALAEGKECDHPCCVEARAKSEVCTKCNPGAVQPAAAPAETPAPAVVLAVDAESCCGKAKAEGKACDHPCCVEAAAKNAVCFKCNPNAGKTAALAKGLKENSCCFTALLGAKACDHPCCVEAEAAGKICEKCNPKAA
ncbi:MAG: c-type cytochrome [Candidatus Hydrogenedentes bacterium]|nr:c-type cytochrome [Candidatus Hydrogenedentota bacterium]